MSVIEFLSSMGRGQAIANLSEPEFINQLLNSSTGRAHSLLLDYVSNGEPLSGIYAGLINNFDNRLSANDAKARLALYRARKSFNLAKVVADIQSMAGRAATNFPEGPSRRSLYNMEAVAAFIRSLPSSSSVMANNTYHTLSAKLGRAATFDELSKAVTIWRSTIDEDIKSHGETAATKGNNSSPSGKPHKKGGASSNAKGYAIAAGNTGPQAAANTVNTGGDGGNGNSNSRRKADGKKGGYKGKNPNSNNAHTAPKSGHYCSLCGNVDHVAVNGCPFMITDSGKTIKVNPTQGVCGKCPSSIMPRLNHNEGICPYRPKGPLFGTTK